MHARLWLNVVLLLAVAALGSWLLLGEPPAPPLPPPVAISAIDPTTVNRIHLGRPGNLDLLLQRSGTEWQIVSPVQARVNPFRVNSLLSLLQTYSISTFNADPGAVGLTDNNSVVTLEFDEAVFRFGDTNPLDQSRYLLHRNTIHLIEDTLYQQLLQDAGFFVDKRLLSDVEQLVSVTLSDPALSITDPALLIRWQHLEAERVSLADATLSGAELLLETTTGEKIPFRVHMSPTEVQLLRPDTGLVYHLPAAQSADLGLTTTVTE
jgi:Domain of unknown function (DUF4340)